MSTSPSARPKGIAGFAIENPYFIVVACLMVLILGSLALVRLPKDLLPSSRQPAVQILSFYPGMPVDYMVNDITSRYERYTGQAIGMERQESKSLVGVSIVKNFFNADTDLNTAIAQTTSLTMSVLRRLPPGTQPPLILPFDPMAATPLALVAVGTETKPQGLYDAARYSVRNEVQSIEGAMAPTVMGGAEREVIVYTDPKKLSEFNMSPLDVMNTMSRLNTFIPAGDVKMGNFDYQILSNGLVDKISDMNDFPLRSEDGVPVYVKQIGKAEDTHKIQTNIVLIDDKPELYVPIYRQPGANSLKIVDETRRALVRLSARHPDFSFRLVADQSVFIRHAIHSIAEEAAIGGGLAALLILLFLGNPRATFGILLSLPLSLLVAFIGLLATDQTLNAMTLGGLALSIGVLVDNSIVVLENISKKLGLGMAPRDAALTGASEVSMPVLASTLSTLVVFLPVLFLKGIVKILFAALAKAVMFVMIGSFFAAMAVIPLFAAFCMNRRSSVAPSGLLGVSERLIGRMTLHYGTALRGALHYRKVVLGLALAVFAVGAFLATRLGTELFPRADAGNFILELRLPTGTRIEKTTEFAKEIDAKLRQWIPAHDLAMIIANAGVYYGFPAAFTPNAGTQDVFFNVELTEDRTHTSQYYARVLREKIPQGYPQVAMGIELGGLLSSAINEGLRAPLDLQVEGASLTTAYAWARQAIETIRPLHGAVDVRIQQTIDAPAFRLDVNREKSAQIGLTTEEIVKNVVSAVSGSATFNPAIWVDPATGIDYFLGVQFLESQITRMIDLTSIPITGRNQSRSVPLGQIAKMTETKVPSEIDHVNLKPVVDIFLDAQDRDIGGLSKDILNAVRSVPLPAGYTAHLRGETASMNDAAGSLGGGFLLAAILVYLILVVQFKSFALPLIIMAAVPLGMVGVVLMLFVTHTYFSIQAAIGSIFMIGIAVANGVLLIEFIQHDLQTERNLESAIVRGASARFRPIIMTSLASIFGLIPMAIGFGHGSEANIPLGRAVIGGQLLSTTLTIFVVPILFSFIRGRTSEIPPSPPAVSSAESESESFVSAGPEVSHDW